jgi:hypothetical protein
MTIYISGAFQCSDQKILHDLYYAGGEARTAQALVLSGPDGSSIDVINVHAPSKLVINMKRLGQTIANVMQNMNPTMICMCEVGEATIPLTEEQMQQVSYQSMHAWKEAATEHFKGAATEHFELRSMSQVGAPYMTIYKDGAIQCSCHRILKDLYNAGDLPRMAQTFLCCGPGDVTVDVINVHAPSRSKKKLTDQQRKTLLTNLLQSNSKSMPGRAIGKVRFLIGGDMNTRHEHFTLSTPLCQPATE